MFFTLKLGLAHHGLSEKTARDPFKEPFTIIESVATKQLALEMTMKALQELFQQWSVMSIPSPSSMTSEQTANIPIKQPKKRSEEYEADLQKTATPTPNAWSHFCDHVNTFIDSDQTLNQKNGLADNNNLIPPSLDEPILADEVDDPMDGVNEKQASLKRKRSTELEFDLKNAVKLPQAVDIVDKVLDFTHQHWNSCLSIIFASIEACRLKYEKINFALKHHIDSEDTRAQEEECVAVDSKLSETPEVQPEIPKLEEAHSSHASESDVPVMEDSPEASIKDVKEGGDDAVEPETQAIYCHPCLVYKRHISFLEKLVLEAKIHIFDGRPMAQEQGATWFREAQQLFTVSRQYKPFEIDLGKDAEAMSLEEIQRIKSTLRQKAEECEELVKNQTQYQHHIFQSAQCITQNYINRFVELHHQLETSEMLTQVVLQRTEGPKDDSIPDIASSIVNALNLFKDLSTDLQGLCCDGIGRGVEHSHRYQGKKTWCPMTLASPLLQSMSVVSTIVHKYMEFTRDVLIYNTGQYEIPPEEESDADPIGEHNVEPDAETDDIVPSDS